MRSSLVARVFARLARQRLLVMACLLCVLAALATPPGVSRYGEGYDAVGISPPLIPFLYRVLGGLLPQAGATRVVDGLQVALALPTWWLLVRGLTRRFDLDPKAMLLIGGVLAVPHLQSTTFVPSESLSYSFLCLLVTCTMPLLEGSRSLGVMVGALVACLALALTKEYAILFLPFVVAVVGYHLFIARTGTARGRLIIAILAILMLGSIVQAAYNYRKGERGLGSSAAPLPPTRVMSTGSSGVVPGPADESPHDVGTRFQQIIRAGDRLLIEQAIIGPLVKLFVSLFLFGVACWARNRRCSRLLLFTACFWIVGDCLSLVQPPQGRYTLDIDTIAVAVVLAIVSRSLLGPAVAPRHGTP